jgi:MFS transporter, putative metabolite:H+ symporter
MSTLSPEVTQEAQHKPRSRGYLVYLIIFMGLVALMDQYLSTIKTTALPYILDEYHITPTQFSNLEGIFFIFTFFIFLLNSLVDRIGRKYSILLLVLIMGLASLGVLLFSQTIYWFMIMYTLAIFATVSNMWTIPISEESPTQTRAKYVALVYIIGLIPLQALLPPLIINTLHLSWKWMYGVMSLFMLPLLVIWFFMKETGRYEAIKQERKEGTRKNHLFGIGVINRKDVRYIIFSSSVWLCWLVYQFFYYWVGYYFMTIKGYTLSQWSTILLVTLILAMGGGYLSGWIMDKLGRKPTLIMGCVGLALVLLLLAFGQGFTLIIATALIGFFTSFTYTWIVVYIPEVFPTERRGACIGWTTTVARISYVVGPLLVGFLLNLFPTMEWFWVVGAAIMLLPIAIVLFFNPAETKVKSLEAIETERS